LPDNYLEIKGDDSEVGEK